MTSALPAVDAATLTDLRYLGVDEFRRLIPLFLEDACRRIDGLSFSCGNGSLEGLAEVAHSLRGSCSTFGALVLADLCTNLEHLVSHGGDLRALADLIQAIEAEFGRVRGALAVELKDARAAT